MRYGRLGRIALALIGSLIPGQWASAQAPAALPLPTLTTIKDIRALSQDEGARGYPVRVRGTVTHIDERADVSLIVHDGKFGQFFVQPTDVKASFWRDLRRGDVVEVQGRTVRGGFAPNVQPHYIRTLSRGAPPVPKRIPYGSMITGRHDCDYVEVVGVVVRAWLSADPQVLTLFADVAFEEGVVRATFWDYSPEDLPRLIDARVRLRGNVGTLFGRSEQLRGVSLFVGRTSDVVVLESPPDPFSLPTRSVRSIYNYSPAGEVNRRIRVHGVVTCYIPGHPVELSDFTSTARFRFVRHVVYVDDGTGSVRVETEQPERLRPGTVVQVAGFPAVTPGKPILTNAVFKVAGEAAQPQAIAVDGGAALTPENDAALVRMEGHLLSMLMSPTQRILVLKVGEIVIDAALENTADAAAGALEKIRPGSVVAVTGVYSYQWGPPPSFRLFLRSASDVTLVSAGAVVDAAAHGRDGRDAGARRLGRRFLVQDDRAAEAPRVSGGAQRAQPGRTRTARHARAGSRRDRASARGGRGQLGGVAGDGAAITRGRERDAALQPGGGAAIGHGPALTGAREPRPRRAP